MEFLTTKFFAGKRKHDIHQYGGFHCGRVGVEMHGYKDDEIVEIELEVIDHAVDYDEQKENEPEVYFGVYNFEKGETNFVYNHILATKICAPDFFKHEIENQKGIFVKIKVNEI